MEPLPGEGAHEPAVPHEPGAPIPALRVREAFVHWAACALAWGLLVLVAVRVQWHAVDLSAAGYLLAGIYLNRRVLRRLIVWHPQLDTVQNVSSGKLSALLFWPVVYPVLMFKLVVVKVL